MDQKEYILRIKSIEKQTRAILAAAIIAGGSLSAGSLYLAQRQNEACVNLPASVREYNNSISAKKRLENVMTNSADSVFNYALYRSGLNADKLAEELSSLEDKISASKKDVDAFNKKDTRIRWIALGGFFAGLLTMISGVMSYSYSNKRTCALTKAYQESLIANPGPKQQI